MRKGPHPFWFFLLILPYGSAFGFVSVALQYIATRERGIAVDAFAAVIAAAFAVHGVKFLWAPVVDTLLTKKVWYVLALALMVLGTVASAAMPIDAAGLGLLTAVVVASQVGLTLMGMACENFLAALPEQEKGRASGWYQAGSCVGLGVGGDLALELSEKLPHGWMVGAVMAACMLPSLVALRFVPEPEHSGHTLGAAMQGLGRDLVGMIFREFRLRPTLKIVLSVVGVSGLLISLSPVGAGAASGLFPSIANDWSASSALVARVNGSVGGLVQAVGALVGGMLADRINRRLSYALGGGLTALAGLAMAYGPRTEWSYAASVLVYSFFSGIAFSAFAAFVLETIGKGAVATKYNIFASLANLAISYMTRLDGWAYKQGGATRMLVVDAGATVAGIAFLLVLMALLRAQKSVPDGVPSTDVAP